MNKTDVITLRFGKEINESGQVWSHKMCLKTDPIKSLCIPLSYRRFCVWVREQPRMGIYELAYGKIEKLGFM